MTPSATESNGFGGVFKSKALVCHAPNKPFTLEEVYIDRKDLDDNQAVVEFKATGICHTDLSIQAGVLPHAMPCVLGHEGAGVIKSLPPGYKGNLAVGDTVLCSFNPCGSQCTSCKTGYPAACHQFFARIFFGFKPDGSTTDSYTNQDKNDKINLGFFGQSSFMQYGVVSLESMIKVDSDLPLHLICAFGCGVMTGLGTVLNKLMPPKQRSFDHLPGYSDLNLSPLETYKDDSPKTIAVFGLGAVGIGSIVGARLAKIKNIIAIDVLDSKKGVAMEAGATHFLNGRASTEDLVKQIKEISSDGTGANMTLEASGSRIALANAIACLAPMGRCAGVGAPAMGETIDVDMNGMIANNFTYMGVLLGDCNTSIMLPYMVALFKRGDFDVMKKLVSTYKPEQMTEAIQDMKDGKVVKPVIVW